MTESARLSLRSFTLLELLVVVAVITILAGLAIPNFLEAQTRAKVSRTVADLKTISGALEAYRIDTNSYPEDYATAVPREFGLGRLTSPISYLTAIPLDPFGGYFDDTRSLFIRSFTLGTEPDLRPSRWALTSVGPNMEDNTVPIFDYPGHSDDLWENPSSGYDYTRYDPTNGTISVGDIIRVSDHNLD